MAKTLFDKIWDGHVVVAETDGKPAVLYIDLHLIHEVTSPQAFSVLDERDLKVRCPEKTLAVIDHSTPTIKDKNGNWVWTNIQAKDQVKKLIKNTKKHGIKTFGFDSIERGIVHVMAPEQGAVWPGMTIVCGDSHTSTHGAFGALAFGIGTTQVGHVLATQSLLMRKPKTMCVWLDGKLADNVTPKDVILAIIAEIGVGGGTGYVLEYRGECIEDMDMAGRMTVCNMSIEAGARAGMIAPDRKTIDYIRGRAMAPKNIDEMMDKWLELKSDKDCEYDKETRINASKIKPMVTYGTNPGQAIAIDETVPENIDYMGFKIGEKISDQTVNVVFIGSCTNSRLEDLKAAAEVFKGKKIANGIEAIIVPGSELVKKQAEDLGLDEIFIRSGASWREPGCSMCIGMNGDIAKPGQLVVSTSNRNFEGRQGKGVRTVLASPASAAASAISGKISSAKGGQ